MSWFGLFEIPGTDVPTPPAGKVRVFVDADGNPAFKDDAGVVHSMVGADGQGVPAGGTTGQVPVKASGADFDTAWTTLDAASVGAQPANANLTGIAALTPAADQSAYYNGTAWAAYTVTSAGRALSGVAGTANTFPYFSAPNVVTLGSVGTTGLASLAAANAAAGRTAIGAADATTVVDLASAQTVSGVKTFTGAQVRIQSTAPGFWLDETDGNYGTYIVHDADALRFQQRNPNFGTNIAARFAIDYAGARVWSAYPITPDTDGARTLGSAAFRFSTVFATNATINTSDARLKTDPRQLRDAEFKAFSAICRLPSVWRWLSRVHGDENCEPEGRAARKHFGPTVQAAVKVFSDHGLEAFENAPFCYDEWPAEEATYDEDGNELTPAREAGSRYSFRKEELLCGMVSALAREIDEKDAEIVDLRSIVSDLVSRVAALEAGRNP